MNNTVTPRQVEAMEKQVEQIASKAKTKMEEQTIEFLSKVSKEWEDEVAVEFAQSISNSMNGCITSLEKNGNSLMSGIVNVHNMYAQQARKPAMNASRITLHSAINPSVVKSTFDDGDTYGLVSQESLNTIKDDFNKLVNDLKATGSEAANELKAIHAYGCREISDGIQKKAQEFVDAYTTGVNTIVDTAETKITDVAKGYNQVMDGASDFFQSLKIDTDSLFN